MARTSAWARTLAACRCACFWKSLCAACRTCASGGQPLEYLSNTSFRGPAQLWVDGTRPQPRARKPYSAPEHAPERCRSTSARPPRIRSPAPWCAKTSSPRATSAFRLVFAAPGAALPAWSAGAHVDVVAGGFRRKYSLCGAAMTASTCRSSSSARPRARGSRHFCRPVQPATPCNWRAQRTCSGWMKRQHTSWLIAAGIGITPCWPWPTGLQAGQAVCAALRRLQPRPDGPAAARVATMARPSSCHVGDEGGRMHLPTVVAGVQANHRCTPGPNRLIDDSPGGSGPNRCCTGALQRRRVAHPPGANALSPC